MCRKVSTPYQILIIHIQRHDVTVNYRYIHNYLNHWNNATYSFYNKEQRFKWILQDQVLTRFIYFYPLLPINNQSNTYATYKENIYAVHRDITVHKYIWKWKFLELHLALIETGYHLKTILHNIKGWHLKSLMAVKMNVISMLVIR